MDGCPADRSSGALSLLTLVGCLPPRRLSAAVRDAPEVGRSGNMPSTVFNLSCNQQWRPHPDRFGLTLCISSPHPHRLAQLAAFQRCETRAGFPLRLSHTPRRLANEMTNNKPDESQPAAGSQPSIEAMDPWPPPLGQKLVRNRNRMRLSLCLTALHRRHMQHKSPSAPTIPQS